MNYPQALENLILEFMKYPGIGRKTAERYALFSVNKIDDDSAKAFSEALLKVKSSIKQCSICGHLTDVDPCSICTNPHRNQTQILVVETAKDVFSIEKSGRYHGLYHVLNGALSPMNGVGLDDLNFQSLWIRVQNDIVSEIIIATSATQEGEATAMYIKRVLKDIEIKVSRIGYGVPVGGNLEFADSETLSRAIENRREF
jgi:recombination protein RecR